MKPLKFLADGLKSYFNSYNNFSLEDFLSVENVLYLLRIISPDLDPKKAYVLLRGYSIMNQSKKDEQLFFLQQARNKFLVYSSKMRWDQAFSGYMDPRYSGIRLYELAGDKLIVTQNSIPMCQRESQYRANLQEQENAPASFSIASSGKYKFYRQDKQSVTLQIPDIQAYTKERKGRKASAGKSKRNPISISYEELLDTALEMRKIVPADYCYSTLKNNTLERTNKATGNNGLLINNITNIVGMVGSGKTTLLKVLCFYLAKRGYRVAIVLNTVSDVVDIYKYLKQFDLSVSPLVGKSDQEKYAYSLLDKDELYIDADVAQYLTAPCILNGFSNEKEKAWQFSERPCYKLRPCDNEQGSQKVRCPFYDFCPGAAMTREAVKSNIIVTTVAGLAAAFVGGNHKLFLEEIVRDFDVVMFDECDRVQGTLDDFFAPNTSFNDFMRAQSNSCAYDMCKSYSDVTRDRNEREYYTLARETTQVYDAIVGDIRKIIELDKNRWGKIVSSTFSALTLLRQMESDKVNEKLVNSLKRCINFIEDDYELNDLAEQVSEICDDSCREYSHSDKKLKRLLSENEIEINDSDFLHLQLVMKVIFFDRLMHRIDNAAKSVDREILWNNNISDFLQARFASQQKYLPSAPMGNMFGMVYTNNEELKVYRQYACGRYLMLSLPWLRVDAQGEPRGPRVVLMSGSSYAPGSLQYHVNAPADYVLKAPSNITNYLKKAHFMPCGATTVISGGGQDGRGERIGTLLREIREHIETELDRPGKILFIVNSYNEAKETMQHTKSFLTQLNRQDACAVVIRDDEERKESCMLRKSDLKSFASRTEKILIAPAAVISRGYNIVDADGNSAFRSIFFLVRPMSVPDDLSLKISRLNGYIAQKFTSYKVTDWGQYADMLKNEAGKFWGIMERDTGGGLANLSEESKRDITATVFIMLLQTYGRAARVGNMGLIDSIPPRIYFADGAFNSGRGNMSFDILKEICSYIEELMKTDSNIATTLYGTFYNALKENINNESTKEIADDDFYSESFHD